jgi:aerobic C4-dicarboxylate transport protein
MNLSVTWLTLGITILSDPFLPHSQRKSIMTTAADRSTAAQPPAPKKRDRTHWLYIAVIIAVVAGVIVGLVAPGVGEDLGVLGTMFVSLIKMMISPVIFCTIVLGIGSVRAAATVGKVGGLAFGYFLLMSTVALAIGLVVGNLLTPGSGLTIDPSKMGTGEDLADKAHEAGGTLDFLQGIIPTSMLSALTEGSVLQTLFIALLVGFAIQALPTKSGDPILRAIELIQKVVFKVLGMILWLAPIGAFGAIANVVGQTGWSAITELLTLMLGFYVTCAIFVFVILGLLLRIVSGISIFKLVRYLAREYLLIFATSSSESALPRLIAKMEHLGVERTTVGVVVPTGYSFNLDGTAIYLTMASLFVAEAMGDPLSLSEQISLLVFMIVASKGAAGVSGAGLATLAGGLQSHRPELLEGVGLIVGIDRFMSEARAVTNFSGNAVATMLVGSWTKTVDMDKVNGVLAGKDPFDELSMVDDGDDRWDKVEVDDKKPVATV